MIPPWTVTAMLALTKAYRRSKVRFTQTSGAASSPTFSNSTVIGTTSPGTATVRPRPIVAFTIRGAMTTTDPVAEPVGINPPWAFVYARAAVVFRRVPLPRLAPLRTATSKDHESPGGIPGSRAFTPLGVGVDVPPSEPEESDTYKRPAGRVTFTHRVPAESPEFARSTVMTNASRCGSRTARGSGRWR